jgi:hypothetical protein
MNKRENFRTKCGFTDPWARPDAQTMHDEKFIQISSRSNRVLPYTINATTECKKAQPLEKKQ